MQTTKNQSILKESQVRAHQVRAQVILKVKYNQTNQIIKINLFKEKL